MLHDTNSERQQSSIFRGGDMIGYELASGLLSKIIDKKGITCWTSPLKGFHSQPVFVVKVFVPKG